MLHDLRYAVRMLLKSPGFTLVALLSLALGIGANTAIFSVVNPLVFRPLPFREPDRLVWIANILPGAGLSGSTSQSSNFLDWREQNHSFEELTAYYAFFDYQGFRLTGSGQAERLRGVGVTRNFLETLGIRMPYGRGFSAEECLAGGPKAIILTYRFWKARFGGDPRLVGQAINVNGQPSVIAGILPPTFDFSSIFAPGSAIDMLMPLSLDEDLNHQGNTIAVIGRLKPGVSIPQAQAEFDLINQRLRQAHPERGAQFGAALSDLQERIRGLLRAPFLVLAGAVGCVLLIACANLSNLLLARATSRRKEIALRIALGASRWRLIRQMLVESVVLALGGAALGLVLASTTTRMLANSSSINIPLLATISVDRAALLFTLAIAVASGILSGLAPAILLSSNSDVGSRLKETGRTASVGRHRGRLRETLVVSEIALACVLLVGAGLFIRSFIQLLDVDLGFRPAKVVAWRLDSSRQFNSPAEVTGFVQDMAQRVKEIPGVESVGFTDTLPLGRNRSWGVQAKGAPNTSSPFVDTFPRIVYGDYIQTMGIPLLSGRDFNPDDKPDHQAVILVNETMARRLWPGKNPIGQTVLFSGPELHVIGVVGDVRHSALDEAAGPEMYLLGSQVGWGAMELVVRTRLSTDSLVHSVRTILNQMDPQMPAGEYQTLEQIVDQAASPRRLITLLLGAFSGLALILASLGVYGVISYSVAQRSHEIGIRMAIGAQKRDVLQLVMGEGMKLAMIGIALGLVGSLVATRLIKSQLFGVGSADPLTFAANALLLTTVAMLACYLPARRAALVDPMTALRME